MKFIVNDSEWNLVFVPAGSMSLQRSDGTFTIGVSDNNVKTVYMAEGLSDYMTDRVLCHELTHVFSFENDCHIPIETEEVIADFMATYGRSIIYCADQIISRLIRRIG